MQCFFSRKSLTLRKFLLDMKKIVLFLMFLGVTFMVHAQVVQPTETPQLEFVLQLRVTLGEAYAVGETPRGRRNVVPITGGTFEGPLLKGTILNGGADYQMGNADGSRTEIEAIYSIRTDDGVNIHIRNCGIITTSKDAEGRPSFYFKCAPRFEAPADSRYAWLNNSIFVCQPTWVQDFKGIVLNVWKVN